MLRKFSVANLAIDCSHIRTDLNMVRQPLHLVFNQLSYSIDGGSQSCDCKGTQAMVPYLSFEVN